jgi:hypothetical protein
MAMHSRSTSRSGSAWPSLENIFQSRCKLEAPPSFHVKEEHHEVAKKRRSEDERRCPFPLNSNIASAQAPVASLPRNLCLDTKCHRPRSWQEAPPCTRHYVRGF